MSGISPFSPWLLVLVIAGSALGGLARFGLSGWVATSFGERFPWGTLAVNLTGAFAIGLLAARFVESGLGLSGPGLALFVGGFLGSYTTVSSFSLQTFNLILGGEHGRAVANAVASVAGCLGAAACGYGLHLLIGAWP